MVHEQTLSALNDETVVYPGHHYNRLRHTSIGREKVTGFLNPSHEIRLKSAMQPKMMFRLLYPVVSCVYPVLQVRAVFAHSMVVSVLDSYLTCTK